MNIGKKSVSFQAGRDIPSLEGRVILVTGGNTGLGKQCALELALRGPARIFITARNVSAGRAAVEDIKKQLPKPVEVTLVEMDLSSLESVKKAASSILADSDRLDLLILNAGVMAIPPGLSTDGYEIQWSTNYLGHALLAKMVTPLLEKTASLPGTDVRIVALASHGHNYALKPEGIRFDALKTKCDDMGPYNRYGQSKLAVILWTKQIAKLYPQFTAASVDPGAVKTELMNKATGSSLAIRVLGKVANHVVSSIEKGARNPLWAAVGQGVQSGKYYEPVGIVDTETELARDAKLQHRLWDWTESELVQYLP